VIGFKNWVNWRQDGITRRYIAEHEAELTDPTSMTPDLLAGTTTYCQTLTNPYVEELVRRAGLWKKYMDAYYDDVKRANVVRRAAKAFNIELI